MKKFQSGQPEHYDAPWWRFIIAIGFTVFFGTNGLLRYGDWVTWKRSNRR